MIRTREHAVGCVRCQNLTWQPDAVCRDCIERRVWQDVAQLASAGIAAEPHYMPRPDGRVVVDPAEVLAVLSGAS